MSRVLAELERNQVEVASIFRLYDIRQKKRAEEFSLNRRTMVRQLLGQFELNHKEKEHCVESRQLQKRKEKNGPKKPRLEPSRASQKLAEKDMMKDILQIAPPTPYTPFCRGASSARLPVRSPHSANFGGERRRSEGDSESGTAGKRPKTAREARRLARQRNLDRVNKQAEELRKLKNSRNNAETSEEGAYDEGRERLVYNAVEVDHTKSNMHLPAVPPLALSTSATAPPVASKSARLSRPGSEPFHPAPPSSARPPRPMSERGRPQSLRERLKRWEMS